MLNLTDELYEEITGYINDVRAADLRLYRQRICTQFREIWKKQQEEKDAIRKDESSEK